MPSSANRPRLPRAPRSPGQSGNLHRPGGHVRRPLRRHLASRAHVPAACGLHAVRGRRSARADGERPLQAGSADDSARAGGPCATREPDGRAVVCDRGATRRGVQRVRLLHKKASRREPRARSERRARRAGTAGRRRGEGGRRAWRRSRRRAGARALLEGGLSG